jgi:hypothetical protein
MNTRSGDSCTRLHGVLDTVKGYLARRRIYNIRVRAIEADALPIVTVAWRPALDGLDGIDYLGSTGGADQFVLRLKGISIRWDRPREVLERSGWRQEYGCAARRRGGQGGD